MKLIGTDTLYSALSLYVPGVKLEGVCPKCCAEYTRDFKDAYLSYPLNVPEEVPCCCNLCGHEWIVLVRLNVSLELVEPKRLRP